VIYRLLKFADLFELASCVWSYSKSVSFVSLTILKGKVNLKPTTAYLVCFLSAFVTGELSMFALGEEAFAAIFRVAPHYLDHPHIFWLIQSVIFGFVAMAWWQTFSRSNVFVRSLTAVLATWLAVLFAAVPCSFVWILFEFGPFSFSSNEVFDLLPQGFEAAVVLYVSSSPFNIVGTIAATIVLLLLPHSKSSLDQSLVYFRPAQSQSVAWNLAKTLAQTALFWFSFLYLIPQILLSFERFIRIEPFQFPAQSFFAATGFVIASFGGLWSGATMAVIGQGTPLPFDTAAKLVVAGPYKYVRNPMALFGLAQGLCVGIFLGSYFIFPYVLLGAWLWNTFVRPVEEAELRMRFGADYDAYCREVSCWRIRFKK